MGTRPAIEMLRDVQRQLAGVHDSDAMLAGLFAFAPFPVQLYSVAGRSLLTNQAFRDLFGSEPPPSYNVLEDEIAEANGILGHIRQAFAGEVVETPAIWYDPRELRQVEVQSARRVAISTTCFPLFDAAGAVTHVVVVAKDETESQQARERVEREREHFRGLLMQAPAAVAIVRVPEYLYELSNPINNRILGRDPTGLRVQEAFPAALASVFIGQVDRVLATGEPWTTTEARLEIPTAEGPREIFVNAVYQPLHGLDGRAEGVICFGFEVTEHVVARRKLEAARVAVQASERRFRSLVLATSQIIWTCAQDGTLVELTPSWEAFTGQTPEQYLGLGWLQAVHPDDRLAVSESWERARNEKARYQVEYRLRRADGSYAHNAVFGAPVLSEDGTIVEWVGMHVDISARKDAELALERLYHEAEQARAASEDANRAKDEFLAMLGHELRNPLAPITTALQLMKLRSAAQPTKEQAIIERQVEHLSHLVDDLLDVSRITRGKIDLQKSRVDLAHVLARAVEMSSPLLERHRHRLQVDVPRGLFVDGDQQRLAQVFSNLLTNAAKYTRPLGRIELRGQLVDGRVIVTVRDDGVGIAPDLLPRVFDLFVQGPRRTDRAQGGLGLGLALVRSLVDLHGGRVHAESAGAGQGSTFVVELPAAGTATTVATTVPTPAAVLPTAGRRVLIVDDNVDAALLLGEYVESFGHTVEVAHDGPAAIALAPRLRPEVAILDIGLPVMDGYELGARLRELLGPDVRLVALTGYGQEHDRARSFEAGFAAHLVKPVDPVLVLAALRPTS